MTSHEHLEDPRNARVKVWMNGRLVPRDEAVVSIFDSGFLMGDGVWEGLRVHGGRVPFLDRHLDRLEENARALALDLRWTRDGIREAIAETLRANAMDDGVHMRLMVTRGRKTTPFQGTSVNVGGPTRILLAEFKRPPASLYETGLKLATIAIRRGRPDVQDPAWNSHSKLNCVAASIAAERAGGDEGLMLDPHGFVATCNSTHFFIVRRGALVTSTGRYCLRGVTREVVLELARAAGIPTQERDFSLTEVYGAQEAFCTGTYAGLIPVRSVDGRDYALPGPITARLRSLYDARARDPEA
ncbi:MAG: aminotransferase class IV [Myxococcales bacterium]|nr:aminotransferase class IV [Myxococcales bacterium]MCB9755179.1 aminotransferase class IV [Myxococcales bacterium]